MTETVHIGKEKPERYLIFRIFNSLYGIEANILKEVFKTKKILKLPRTSAVLEGIVNLRGHIVSVFNLSVLLWGEENFEEDERFLNTASNQNIILLLTIKNQDVGILVDQIQCLDTIIKFQAKDHFQGNNLTPPSLVSQIGLLSDEQQVFILDIEDVLGSYLNERKPPIEATLIEDDVDFDFDQYTLPDEPSEDFST